MVDRWPGNRSVTRTVRAVLAPCAYVGCVYSHRVCGTAWREKERRDNDVHFIEGQRLNSLG